MCYVVTRLVNLRCIVDPDYHIPLVFPTQISLHYSNAGQRLRCIGLKADHCGWLQIQLLILLEVISFIQRGEIYSQDLFLSFIFIALVNAIIDLYFRLVNRTGTPPVLSASYIPSMTNVILGIQLLITLSSLRSTSSRCSPASGMASIR